MGKFCVVRWVVKTQKGTLEGLVWSESARGGDEECMTGNKGLVFCDVWRDNASW